MNEAQRQKEIATARCGAAYAEERRQKAQVEADGYAKDRAMYLFRLASLEHPCVCVKHNNAIEIWDMAEQERRGRRAVGDHAGLRVADCLSARLDCIICKGTGKPLPPEPERGPRACGHPFLAHYADDYTPGLQGPRTKGSCSTVDMSGPAEDGLLPRCACRAFQEAT